MALPYTVKVIEDCHVSPPPNSVPPTSLPLAFFDMPWFLCCPIQRIFFYEYPHPPLHFINTILPMLKHSLSLTLQHFFPFAASLMCPPQPTKPHILYAEGDSVPLTIAEYTGDFAHLLNNYTRDVKEFHPLVPQLPPVCASDGTHEQVISPLLALQVTIFPNSGICIGITFRHMVADGRAFNHFVKSWASIFKSKGDLSCSHNSLPLCDRSIIKESEGLESIFLNQWWTWRSSLKDQDTTSTATLLKDRFRATFIMSRHDIERLKQWLLTQCKSHRDSQPLHVSTFVATCAFIWVCLIKSQDHVMSINNKSVDDNKLQHFCFVADCRNRDEICVPINYFGNCLAFSFLSAKRAELVGENGVVVAAKVIGSKVKELESGVLKGAEKWISDYIKFSELEDGVSVAGSPRLPVYEMDFGWGRPKKTEVVHIDVCGAFSLAPCRDEEGGIEVGLALNRVEMEAFISIFEQGQKIFSTC